MLIANYHTHVKYCHHAVKDVEDYVKKACELGFIEIGMSDHAPVLENFMTKKEYDNNYCFQNMKMDVIPKYINDIELARNKYNIKIYSGFETEFLPDQLAHYKYLKSLVDYLNLGMHFFSDGKKVINSYDSVNYTNVKFYAQACVSGMASGLFNTLVHPDLFMYGYKDINGNRIFDDECAKASRLIIETAIKYNVYLELNAGGLKYAKTEWLYPAIEFWRIAKEYKDLKIIIGADAHDPNELYNDNVKSIESFAKELGLKILPRMELNH